MTAICDYNQSGVNGAFLVAMLFALYTVLPDEVAIVEVLNAELFSGWNIGR